MAGFGEWVVASRINFTTNGIVMFQRLASQATLANSAIARQQGLIDKNTLAMERYRAKLEETRLAQIKMGTMFSAGATVAGAAALGFSLAEAARLQRAMTGVNIATGANPAQQAMLRSLAIQTSSQTAQSAVTIANEMAAAATTAFHDPKQLAKMFPMMAKYADVRYQSPSHDDPVESISRMSMFAHYFGAYTPDKMAALLDNTAKLQFATHVSLQQLVTQGKYFIPNATKLGVSQDTIFGYLGIMGQTGFLQGRGGTALNNLILNAMSVTPTAHMSKAKAAALSDLGMRNADGSFRFINNAGDLDLIHMVDYLREKRNSMRAANPRLGGAQWMTDVGAIFGKEGQRLASVLADNTTQQQMQRNKQAFDRIPGVKGQFDQMFANLIPQWNIFTTDLANIAMALGTPALGPATAALKMINGGLGNLIDFLTNHQNVAASIFGLGTAMTVAFGIRTLAGVYALTTAVIRLGEVSAVAAVPLSGDAKILGFLDAALLGGMGAPLVKAGGKLMAFINLKMYMPLLALVNRFGPIGTRLAAFALGLDGSVGAIAGGLSRLLGPLGILASVLGYQSSAGNATEGVSGGMIGGHSLRYWRAHMNRAPQIARDQLRQISVNIQSVHLSIDPRNKSDSLHQLLNHPKVSPLLAPPLSVGSSLFNR